MTAVKTAAAANGAEGLENLAAWAVLLQADGAFRNGDAGRASDRLLHVWHLSANAAKAPSPRALANHWAILKS